MDSMLVAAAHALAAGDPLGALNRVALRNDANAIALRGIAMAQLGELDRAKTLLANAARAFGPKEAVARARCVVASAEIALATRELDASAKALAAARVTLEAHGDRLNAAHAAYLEARRLLLVGRADEAERTLAGLDPARLPPAHQTYHALIDAGIAIRRLRIGIARAALARAEVVARNARIAPLMAEVEGARAVLDRPAARLLGRGRERTVLIDEVESLLDSNVLVVDACRNTVRYRDAVVALSKRPVLFSLMRTLAEAWPGDATRDVLVACAFRARHADESYRARLRVEIGRLRRAVRPFAGVQATARGFALVPNVTAEVCVLAWPDEDAHADVLALLADGEAWSSSALATALGTSQRSVQRALDALEVAGKVQSFGGGRSRRWTMPAVPAFATTLLLPASLAID